MSDVHRSQASAWVISGHGDRFERRPLPPNTPMEGVQCASTQHARLSGR
jgi:hypothetical protein